MGGIVLRGPSAQGGPDLDRPDNNDDDNHDGDNDDYDDNNDDDNMPDLETEEKAAKKYIK